MPVPNINNPAWDRFLDFIASSDEVASPADEETELRRLGIDTKKAQSRVFAAVRKARAKAELDRARAELPAIREAMSSVPSSLFDVNRTRLKALIVERCDAGQQLTYFRKLEAVASDEDLQSFLNDLERLDLLITKESNDSRPS